MGRIDGPLGWIYNKGRMGKTRVAERIKILESVSLFRGLSDEAMRYLAIESRSCRFQAGEMIVYQGDPGSACHVIVQGRVRVFVVGEDGRELAVRILGPGEMVGEMALFEQLPRSAFVEAMEETETLELDQDTLLYCLRKWPVLALSMLRYMSARLRYATDAAEGLASLTVTERLIRRLQRLAEWSGVPMPGGVRIVPAMTQSQLAALVGTSRESVNRALVRLRREGKVRMEDGYIVLPNQDTQDGDYRDAKGG